LAPQIKINVLAGKVLVQYQGVGFEIPKGGCELFYSNLGRIIQCVEKAVIKIRVSDEAF